MKAALVRRNVHCRGSAYVALLGLSLLVAVIGTGGLLISRAQSRAADLQRDMGEARLNAVSAVQYGRAQIDKDPNWRSTHVNGSWYANIPLGNGTFSLDVTNPNGPLNNSMSDPVVLTGTGVCGSAVQQVQATLTATVTPLTCLQTAITAGSISFANTTVNASGQVIAAIGSVTAGTGGTGATIDGDVEAGGLVSGFTYNGKTTSNAAPRTMPASTVFDYYKANGTTVSYGSTGGAISKTLISPAANPMGGGTNTRGIYVIDCGGGTLSISLCRVVGTLVVLNTSGVTVQSSVTWDPAVAGYPCLLVQGPLTLKMVTTALAENKSTNLNPTGTPYPYPSGSVDGDTSDSYPSAINGLVYCTGDCTTGSGPQVNILLVGGTLSSTTTLTALGDAAVLANPPPGFYSVQMKLSRGSWRQVVR
jgi:hypothetical protein